eukprot:XP_001701181.1 predicted protein [Chlamydomonas reinhardtii]
MSSRDAYAPPLRCAERPYGGCESAADRRGQQGSRDRGCESPSGIRGQRYGLNDIVKALLTAGADMEHENREGDTPLHCAARNGHTEVVEAMLAGRANKEARPWVRKRQWGYWGTPLHCAAAGGHTEVVMALLTAGADTEEKDEEGDTPLQCAARNGHTEAVKALLAAGANKEAMNRVCSRHSPPVLVEGFRSPLLREEWEPAAAGPPPPGGAVMEPDPEGGWVLGPVGPVAAIAAAAAAPPPSPLQQPLSHSLLRAVKAEPGGCSNGGGGGGGRGMAAGTARYVALAARPFDVAELAALQQHYMEEHTVEKDMSAATRRGTLRPNVRVARLRPAAESSYPQLWPHLQRLRRQVEAEAAAAAAAAAAAGPATAASMGGGGGADRAPSAAEALLFALRVLQEHGRLSGMEAGPRDAVLARVLPGYGAELAAAARAAAAAGLAGVEVVDLTVADEVVDVEEYVLQQPLVEAALKRVKIEE